MERRRRREVRERPSEGRADEGRFPRDSPDESDLDDGGKSLEDRRDSPRPVVLDSKSSEGCPSSDDVAGVPKRVEERGHGSSLAVKG